MHSRILAFSLCCSVWVVACERSPESKLIGTWRGASAENAGNIRFDANHTFTGGEWSLAETHQPPVIPDKGDWRISGSKLVLDFRDTFHQTKHQELVLLLRDDHHIVLRQPGGAEIILRREK